MSVLVPDRTMRPLAAAAAFALVFALVACTAPDTRPPSVTEAPPAVSGNVVAYETATALAECLRAAGWEVEVTDTGGWGVEIGLPPEQLPAYQQARDTCSADLGVDETVMTDELADYAYDNNLRVVECLHGLGYSTPQPPSREAFITALVEDDDEVLWDPYALVPVDEFGRAARSCPQ